MMGGVDHMDVQLLLDTLKRRFVAILGENLVGMYAHGSIAFGCFRWKTSDIDLVVVVDSTIDAPTKLRLLEILVSLLPQAPPKGFEMSIVLKGNCLRFTYPTPYELHFSNQWLHAYHTDPLAICGDEVKTDPDLAAHFTVIRHVGQVLCGAPIEEIFGEVDRAFYLDSIIRDSLGAVGDIGKDPVNVVLNLCRVLAFVQEGLVVSKVAGGQWALGYIDPDFRKIVQTAIDAYTADGCEAAYMAKVQAFCGDMLRRIEGNP
jgi:hypothetical protein